MEQIVTVSKILQSKYKTEVPLPKMTMPNVKAEARSYSREPSFCVAQWILDENQWRKGIMLEYQTWLRFGLKPPRGKRSFRSQIHSWGQHREDTRRLLAQKVQY
ncbi:hypothetical protein llap_16180 [Limosa lapponica baueri]|uniref:Uncharacterized protein n=1 Tax=Limosa lapponica baueri TaxID=1758121 RepID=A0A2I0TIA3_LIMLA|nr:hypothetical protein llap_16180 [Limosa lapponica baueri]